MIEVKNIEKSFDGKRILKGISTVFETGKTNLIHLISEAILYLLRVEIVNNQSIWNQNDNYSKTFRKYLK